MALSEMKTLYENGECPVRLWELHYTRRGCLREWSFAKRKPDYYRHLPRAILAPRCLHFTIKFKTYPDAGDSRKQHPDQSQLLKPSSYKCSQAKYGGNKASSGSEGRRTRVSFAGSGSRARSGAGGGRVRGRGRRAIARYCGKGRALRGDRFREGGGDGSCCGDREGR